VTRCGLVVTTHARADALARVLIAVDAQTRRPDELLVAEDGLDAATADAVARHAASAGYPVRHLRQPHEGFRAGRIRNAAIAAMESDYVVLLDGDMVVHPEFLADHLELARPGHWTQGVRILLDAEATRRVLADGAARPRPWWPGLGLARRGYALRAVPLARRLRYAANRIVAVKSCNQGFWRRDLLAANGFDEGITGWGAEDKELCARLGNAGVRRQTLLLAAVAWHLHHAPAPRERASANRARWQDTRRSGRTRCEAGIDGHGAG
jgi:glycosyltransferase involved in cell wall biosynthesis